jgi:hypothetical protein
MIEMLTALFYLSSPFSSPYPLLNTPIYTHHIHRLKNLMLYNFTAQFEILVFLPVILNPSFYNPTLILPFLFYYNLKFFKYYNFNVKFQTKILASLPDISNP